MEIDRKNDHIKLAFDSITLKGELDRRFYYEPLFGTHVQDWKIPTTILQKQLDAPFWVSSMTGGTKRAQFLNSTLAEVCAELNIGMGLGSCRPILFSKNSWADFDVRSIIGSALPFFANIGIAQLDELLFRNELNRLDDMVQGLNADGLIVHINPMQELFQPEGDKYTRPAIDVLEEFLERKKYAIIVKEVGQGFGPRSISALLRLPIDAIEFGAFGGTNFSLLESKRNLSSDSSPDLGFRYVGNDISSMIDFVNNALAVNPRNIDVIISGGVRDPLSAFDYRSRLKTNSVLGMASSLLSLLENQGKAETINYLKKFALNLKTAEQFLEIRS